MGGDLIFKDLEGDVQEKLVINPGLNKQQVTLEFVYGKQYSNLVNKPARRDNHLDEIFLYDIDLLLRFETEVKVNFSEHKLIFLFLTVFCEDSVNQQKPKN